MDEGLMREAMEKEILHWNYRGLTEIPRELLVHGRNVKEVYLKWNCIKSLDPEIGQLRHLTNIYLSSNNLDAVPDEISQLTQLKVLDLSRNHISVLPNSIAALSNLQDLLISYNELKALPEDMSKMSSLRILQASYNALTKLPSSISKCLELEEINVDHNFLSSLPRTVVFLLKLQLISVCSNQMLYLPAFPFISEQVKIYFDSNSKLNHIPYSVGCKDGVSAYGCLLEDIDLPNQTQIQVLTNGLLNRPYAVLTLPDDIMLSDTTTLTELCLRKVYNMNAASDQLPKNLKSVLDKGPVSKCFRPQCQCCMFTSGNVWVVPVKLTQRLVHPYMLATLFFCSSSCAFCYSLEANSEWEMELIQQRLHFNVMAPL